MNFLKRLTESLIFIGELVRILCFFPKNKNPANRAIAGF